MTITESAAALRARKISSVELVRESLSQIESQNPRLNAFLLVTAESAHAAAAAADRAQAENATLPPLHGIPIALKDVFCTAGIRTTAGSKLFEHHIPTHNSAVTERLAQAGAILIGKTGLHELAYGVTSNNPHFGAIRNPHDPARIPGGSSGGSAVAVASRMVPAAMGSDTGGSIRIPAAFCGIVGLKPTSGRVSRFGVLPLDFTLDHMGPLTRTVADAALILNAIAGHDPRDDSSSRHPTEDYTPPPVPSLEGLRIGRPENFFFHRLHPEIATAVDRCFAQAETLGAHIVPIRLPDIAAINQLGRLILMSEASAVLEPYQHRRADLGPDVRTLIDQGRLLSAVDYINAQRLRRIFKSEFAKIWHTVDCLFTPTAPIPAPLIGQTTVELEGESEDTRIASTRLVRAFNVLGLPAISIPIGFTSQKLPIGLQIVTPPFTEKLLLRIGTSLGA